MLQLLTRTQTRPAIEIHACKQFLRLFPGTTQKGMLQGLIAETMQWKQDFENKKVTRSWRSQLWLHVCQTLQKRESQILLPDLRWPHLQWNHQLQAYDVLEKESVST